MCVLKVCRNVSVYVAQVLSQEKEEMLTLLHQPVLPGPSRYYRVAPGFSRAELPRSVPRPVPELKMRSVLAQFLSGSSPGSGAVLPGREHYRTRRSGTTDARLEEALTSLSSGRPFPVSRYYRVRPGTTAAGCFQLQRPDFWEGYLFPSTFLRLPSLTTLKNTIDCKLKI